MTYNIIYNPQTRERDAIPAGKPSPEGWVFETSVNVEEFLRMYHNSGRMIFTQYDIYQKADEMGYTISEEQGYAVAEQMNKMADCEVGFSWDTLEQAIIEITK